MWNGVLSWFPGKCGTRPTLEKPAFSLDDSSADHLALDPCKCRHKAGGPDDPDPVAQEIRLGAVHQHFSGDEIRDISPKLPEVREKRGTHRFSPDLIFYGDHLVGKAVDEVHLGPRAVAVEREIGPPALIEAVLE